MIIKNCLLGPFLGDFRSEIIDFQPYARWVYEVLKPEKMFIATHSNRSFLYNDWSTVIPIFEDLSRDELNQNGFIHTTISLKDLNIVSKKVKSDLIKQIEPEKEFLHLNVLYSKNFHWFPLYKKIYNKVKLTQEYNNKILFIPNINEKYAIIKDMYDFLVKNYGVNEVIVAGDMKTYLHDKNIMLKNPTYFKDVYYDMVSLISNSKVVVTPNSHWTVISLLQETPVFSWGKLPKYYENNTQNMILHENIPVTNMKNIVKDFINTIK